MDDSLLIKMEVLLRIFEFFNCYVIENINDDDLFFFEGDFGLGVYVIDKDIRKLIKLLGIVFVFKNW